MRTTSPSCTPARRQRALDAHPPQPLLHVGDRVGVGEVGERDRALGGPALHAPRVRRLRARPRSPAPRAAARRTARARLRRRAPRRRARAMRPSELVEPVARHGRDRADRRTACGRDVGLAADDDARPVEQIGPVAAELVEQHRAPVRRAASVDRREVEQDHEHAGALDVAQELVAEAAALGRAFDQPGDVGEHELVLVEAHDAEVRLERRERVVGDLRLGRARPPRSASTSPRSGSRRARRRRAASARGAASALRRTRPARRSSAPGARSTGSARCRVRPGRRAPRASGRRGARGRRAARRRAPYTTVPSGTSTTRSAPADAVLLLARAVRARRGLAVRVVAEREQRRDVAVGPQPHVAAPAAVAAVGTALAARATRAGTRRSPRRRRRPSRCSWRYVDEVGHRRKIRASPYDSRRESTCGPQRQPARAASGRPAARRSACRRCRCHRSVAAAGHDAAAAAPGGAGRASRSTTRWWWIAAIAIIAIAASSW